MTNMEEAHLDMYDNVGSLVEGEMSIPGVNKTNKSDGDIPEFNTLDEPIKDTILRDVKAIGVKFLYVLFPKEKQRFLKEWDLWGPLVLCTFMAMILQGSSKFDDVNDGGPEYAEVFVIVWIGSLIVTVNSKLLGGNISFFQSVCILGYCLLPCTIALIICRIILHFEQTTFLFILRTIVAVTGSAWAIYASMVFLSDSYKQARRALAVYPVFLFYIIICWLIVAHTNV